jgi:DNA-binding CsgD family transcriptional regulator
MLFAVISKFLNNMLEMYSVRNYSKKEIIDIVNSFGLTKLYDVDINLLKKLVFNIDNLMSYKHSEEVFKIIIDTLVKEYSNISIKKYNIVKIYKDIIIDLVSKGYSDNKIAIQLNISRSQINYVRKQLNLKTNFIERTYTSKEERIKGYMLRNVRSSAKRRNLEFDLDIEDISLPKYCPLLEIPLNYNSYGTHKVLGIKEEYQSIGFNDSSRATIDRIDNSKGYVKGNIIILSRIANAMKNEANFNELTTFSKNILKLINWYKNQDALGNITDLFFNKEELSLDS